MGTTNITRKQLLLMYLMLNMEEFGALFQQREEELPQKNKRHESSDDGSDEDKMKSTPKNDIKRTEAMLLLILKNMTIWKMMNTQIQWL